MKVLLFEIGGPRKEYNEPIAIELIGAYLLAKFEEQHIPILVDTKWFFETNRLPNISEMMNYDVIGISLQIGSIEKFNNLYVEYCKIPKPPILILGNAIPTFSSLKTISYFDKAICVKGEGEVAFYEVCKELENSGKILSDICGISCYKNEGEKIVDYSPVPIDVTKLPHSKRSFLDFIRKKGGIARIEGSRGCSWGKCNFCCVQQKYGSAHWRPFPLEYIISELEILGQNKIYSPYFTDEDFFGGDYERGKTIAKAIIDAKEKHRIPQRMNFFLSVMANDVRNPKGLKALELLKKAGLREIFIGIETFSKQQLERFGKKANIDTNKIAIMKLHRLGFQIDIGYILFDPYMKFIELEENLQYIEELTLNTFDSRSLKKLRIQPGTKIKNTYSTVISGELDFDNLMYPYVFQDKKVQMVVDIYEEWESHLKQQTYALQAESRGEIESEDLRMSLKNKLGKVRNIEFKALKSIVHGVSIGSELNSILNKLSSLTVKKEHLL